MTDFFSRYRKSASSRVTQKLIQPVLKKTPSGLSVQAHSQRPSPQHNTRIGNIFGSSSMKSAQVPHFYFNPTRSSSNIDFQEFSTLLEAIRGPISLDMLDAYNKIFELVSDSTFLRSINNDLFTDFFKLLNSHFIRKIDPMDIKVLYSDSRPSFKREAWPVLNVIQKILYLCFSFYDPHVLSKLLAANYIKSLVAMLITTDPDEQQSIELLILLIFETIPGQQQIIFNSILSCIFQYRNDLRYVPAVAPALRFLLSYLRTVEPLRQAHFDLFRNVLYQLMNTSFIGDFIDQMNQITSFFLSKDPTLATFCIKFIIKHWPQTNTDKQISFISSLPLLCNPLSHKSASLVIKQLGEIVASSLESPNYRVSLAAINLLLNPSFAFMCQPFGEVIIPILFKSVVETSRHWNDEVQKMSKAALRALYTIDAGTTGKFAEEGMKVDDVMGSEMTWRMIVGMAENADDNTKQKKLIEIKEFFEKRKE